MPYIDVDLLKESVLGWNPPLDTEQLKHMIDTIPLADVEEVVRCKDCIYFKAKWIDEFDNPAGVCKKDAGWYDDPIEVSSVDFCSGGKKVQK